MLYGIYDNNTGILIEHKNKRYLLKLYYNNELEIKKSKNYKVVNKVKHINKITCILLLETN